VSGKHLSDYDYPLEAERIAQEPALERDHARLMVVNRRTGELLHRRFFEITEFLRPGDLLALNDTRVIPARLHAVKEKGSEIEILLLAGLGDNRWEALIRGKVARGTRVILRTGEEGVVESLNPDGKRVIRFFMEQDFMTYLQHHGGVPLPPYINRNGDNRYSVLDRERYQTIYAKTPGAVAAPTAGLHFTEGLLEKIRGMGVQIVFVTLHVGYGTFKPVTVEDISAHRMDEESYAIGGEAVEAVHDAVREGRRVIAVGSTSARTLESAVDQGGRIVRASGRTGLFIYPGYRFRVVKGLVTNFHLPRSTLLMLTAAFAGKDLLDRSYQEARGMDYRFYSYGDAMLIL